MSILESVGFRCLYKKVYWKVWGSGVYIRKSVIKCGVQVYKLESFLESGWFRCLWYWDRMTKSERMGRKRERNSSSFSADITQVSLSLINIHSFIKSWFFGMQQFSFNPTGIFSLKDTLKIYKGKKKSAKSASPRVYHWIPSLKRNVIYSQTN